MTAPPRFVPYPPIERHGVIGDRRTAALVAVDSPSGRLLDRCRS
jgi:hypothetical protein